MRRSRLPHDFLRLHERYSVWFRMRVASSVRPVGVTLLLGGCSGEDESKLGMPSATTSSPGSSAPSPTGTSAPAGMTFASLNLFKFLILTSRMRSNLVGLGAMSALAVGTFGCSEEVCELADSPCVARDAEECAEFPGCSAHKGCGPVLCSQVSLLQARSEAECATLTWCHWDSSIRSCTELPDAGPTHCLDAPAQQSCVERGHRCGWTDLCTSTMTVEECDALDSESSCNGNGGCIWRERSAFH